MYCTRHIHNTAYYCKFRHFQPYCTYYCKFRHFQPYCSIFRILCNSCIFRTLAYLEPKIYSEICQDIFWYIQNAMQRSHIENCHIQNFTIFRILTYLGFEAYSETCLCTHIQAYLIMIVIITLTFFFSL